MKYFKYFLIICFFSAGAYSQYYGFVVADTPGAYNSYWHTSITLTNFSEQDIIIPSTLYLSDGSNYGFELNVPSKKSISKLLIDILKDSGINLESFFGWIEVDLSNIPGDFAGETLMFTPDPNAEEGAIFAERTEAFIEGKAEILLYPLTPCGKDAKEPMALGGAVWRTNVGFINPSTKAVRIKVECFDGDFTLLNTNTINIDLGPKQIKQINDIKGEGAWNFPCSLIKEPVFCIVRSEDPELKIFAYGANNNNINNFPIYIPPQ